MWSCRYYFKTFYFLTHANFAYVHPGALAENRWTEIEEPFGKAVNALKLVQGWHIEWLFYSVLVAVWVDILVVAILTGTIQSLLSSLTAGSYAVGLQALFLAVLAILEVIIT